MTNGSLPAKGRVGGIDYGTVRIGIAVTNADRTLASPLSNYTRNDKQADARYFRRLVKEEELVALVVGLPVHTSGAESEKSQQARRFAAWLAEVTELPVLHFDERYTTAAADEIMLSAGLTRKRQKERRDMLAAQIMLAAWLEASRRGDQSLESLDD